MKTRIIKIAMDIFMAILLVLLYNTRALGLTFHEIGGLFLGFLFIVHGAFNRKWIISITKNLSGKSISTKSKVRYAIDGLLLITFAVIILSGMFISKVVFPGMNMPGSWARIHLFSAGMALILIGIHVGLHWDFIKQIVKKRIPTPTGKLKTAGVFAVTILLLFGSYNIFASNFVHLITVPIASTEGGRREPMMVNGSTPEMYNRKPNNPNGAHIKNQQNIQNMHDQRGYSPRDHENGKDRHDMRDNRVGQGRAENRTTIGAVLKTMATYLSIISVFAALTIFLEKRYFPREKRIIRAQ